MKDVILVVSDLDGTLFETGDFISPGNIAAIEKLHDRGIAFGIASGHSLYDISRLSRRWGISFEFDVLVALNGCEVYDGINDTVIHQNDLQPETMRRIIELMAPFNLNPFIYYKDGMMMVHEDARALDSSRRNQLKIYLVDNEMDLCRQSNGKILYRIREQDAEDMMDFLSLHPDPDFKAVRTKKDMIEFINPAAGKGKALIQLCRNNRIEMDQVIAFGDGGNDVDMLESCYGVALVSGSEEAKKASKAVTEKSCREDGFADWLEKNIFID